MSTSYVRCQYISPDGHECETHFAVRESLDIDDQRYCPVHAGILPSRNPTAVEPMPSNGKQALIDLMNETRIYVHQMTLPEIDAHIAMLEGEMEKLRTKLATSNASRREKLDKLTDEERAERRKIKLSGPKATAKQAPDKITKKPKTLEDAVQVLMKNHGISEQAARKMMGL